MGTDGCGIGGQPAAEDGVLARADAAGRARWTAPFPGRRSSDPGGHAALFVVSEGRLLATDVDPGGGWSRPWADLAPGCPGRSAPGTLPIGPASAVTAAPGVGASSTERPTSTSPAGTARSICGAAGCLEMLRLLGAVETTELERAAGWPVDVAGHRMVTRSVQGTL